MKSINTNQICAIIFILLISNKLLVLPSILYDSTRNDSILFIIGILLIDLAIIMLFAYTNKKFGNTTFVQKSYQVFGKIITKILLAIILIYFLLKIYITLKETENFLNTTIYIDLSSVIFILPCIVVLCYVVSKGLNNVARVTEIFSILILIGIVVSLILAVPNVHLDGVLPLFTSSSGDVWESLTKASMWFGNYIILFMFVGHVKVEKHYYKKMLVSFFVGFAIIVLLFTFFYCIFGSSSVIHHFAISDITSFTPSLSSHTKIDWFTVLFYSFADIIQLILQLFVIVYICKEIFQKSFGFWFYAICSIVSILFYTYAPFGFDFIVQLGSVTLGFASLIINVSTVLWFYIVFTIKKKKAQLDDSKKSQLLKNKNLFVKKVDRRVV